MLWGEICLWERVSNVHGAPPFEGALVLLSHEAQVTISNSRGDAQCAWDHMNTRSTEESTDRLEDLVGRVIWAIVKASDDDAFTLVVDPPIHKSILVALNIEYIKSLTSKKLSIAERCTLHYGLAVTIVHELMHCISQARMSVTETYVGTRRDDLHRYNNFGMNEPYLDAAGLRELGYDGESYFFGGQVNRSPTYMPISHSIMDWPHARYDCSLAPPGSVFMLPDFEIYLSRNGVHFPDRWGVPVPVRIQDLASVDLNPEDFTTLGAWSEKQRHWESIRAGWYPRYKTIWDDSPWSYRYYLLRSEISNFSDAFESRDEIKCENAAKRIVRGTGWSDGLSWNEMVNNMPTDSAASPLWFYWAVGLLMYAALPLRPETIILLPTRHSRGPYLLTPSKAASAAGRDRATGYRSPEAQVVTQAEASVLWPVFGSLDNGSFTQLDYLEDVRALLGEIAIHERLIWLSCKTSIEDCYNALRKHREELERGYAGRGHTSKWASTWPFQFPEADETIVAFDQTEQRWRTKVKLAGDDDYTWASWKN
ncbi:hypothetical protein GGR57DRAFT_518232 [Xylariaceae sp. FL1272]|nr:hypothetical protein GGR57DRAFT_518232 [Xylariaceae sp. FL1272]